MMIGLVAFCNKLAVDVFEIYIIIRLLRAIFKNDLIDKRFLFLSVVIKLTLSIVVDYYAPYVLVNLLVGTVPILLLVCCYRSVWWKKIAVTFLIIALLVFSEIILAVIIGIDDYGIMAKAQNQQSIALFLSRVIFWIIALFVQRLIPQYNVVKSSAKMTALEIVIFLAMICELFALCVRAGDNLLLESLILLGSEVTVYLMIYLQDCWEELCVRRERASLIEQEKEYYRREAAIITDKQELERQFRHDWRNRLQVLKQPGPVTVTGISHDTLDKMVIVRGDLVRNTAFPSCRTQLEISVPGGIRKLAECYEGRHWALVYGDQSKKIAKANELLGIESMII